MADSDAEVEGSLSGLKLYIDLKQERSLSSQVSTIVINLTTISLPFNTYIVIVNPL